ncbi:Hypothetical protein PHPALM_17923 [Phytophthora palmivora]|uniref:Uncharacterized protein n=1 Tax=Phytophthora palmivora TaxID=4796 RepID=A0A2P4XL79_9STRA|nr:Hypothetical protein PHPALM_17923 [Phytophthora palmivora]
MLKKGKVETCEYRTKDVCLDSDQASYYTYPIPRSVYRNQASKAATPCLSPPLRTRFTCEDTDLRGGETSSRQGYDFVTEFQSHGSATAQSDTFASPSSSCESSTARIASRKISATSSESVTRKRRSVATGAVLLAHDAIVPQRGNSKQPTKCNYSGRHGKIPRSVQKELFSLITQSGGEENTPYNTRLEYNCGTPSRTRSDHVEKTPRQSQGLQKKKTPRSSRSEHNQVTDTGSNPTAAVPRRDEYIHMNKQVLRSEHARCAFCNTCNTEIKFERRVP